VRIWSLEWRIVVWLSSILLNDVLMPFLMPMISLFLLSLTAGLCRCATLFARASRPAFYNRLRLPGELFQLSTLKMDLGRVLYRKMLQYNELLEMWEICMKKIPFMMGGQFVGAIS
jgi:hypothetical protein